MSGEFKGKHPLLHSHCQGGWYSVVLGITNDHYNSKDASIAKFTFNEAAAWQSAIFSETGSIIDLFPKEFANSPELELLMAPVNNYFLEKVKENWKKETIITKRN